MEIMGPSARVFAGMVICFFFATAMLLLGAVASLIREWTSIVLVSNAPFIVLFVYIW